MSQEARRAALMEKLDVFKEEKAKHKWRKDHRRFEDFSSSVLVHTLCLPILEHILRNLENRWKFWKGSKTVDRDDEKDDGCDS